MGEVEGHSSIKVHHAPGGSSSLNIFGGDSYSQPAPAQPAPVQQQYGQVSAKPSQYTPEEDTSRAAGKQFEAPAPYNPLDMPVQQVSHSTPQGSGAMTSTNQMYGVPS